MGDAGEGLIDAESRLQERRDEVERERAERRTAAVLRDPEAVRVVESLRLARVELGRQLESAAHERRRAQLEQALADLNARLEAAERALTAR
jgi:hypothetical protein